MSTERERLIARSVIRGGGEPRRQTSPLPQRPRIVVREDLDLHQSPYAADFTAILAAANAECDAAASRRRT